MNPHSTAPPMPTAGIAFGRPLAKVVSSPVCGSTREILPAAPSVTYSAPSGPTVLPVAPCRPVTSRGAGGLTDGDGALSADGVIIATTAISSELPIRNRPILFIIFPPLYQRIF